MLEQAKGADKTRKEEKVSLYDAINVLIAHGHDKDKILKEYSKDEIIIFLEKCVSYDSRNKADFIESVLAGIGGAFGGGKKIENLLKQLRK